MKKSIFLFAVLFVSTIGMAQSDKHVKELGVVFYNLDTYGLTYRCGSETSLWRFNAVSIEGNTSKNVQESYTTNANNVGFGLSVGKEFRKYINQSVAFKFGADVSYTYYHAYTETIPSDTYTYNTTRKRITSMPGFNLVLGLNFRLHNFMFGAELKPSIQLNTVTEDNTSGALDPVHLESSDLSYGFKSSPVQLSVVYQF